MITWGWSSPSRVTANTESSDKGTWLKAVRLIVWDLLFSQAQGAIREPNGATWEPRGAKREPHGCQKGTKESHRGPMDAKRRQKVTKRCPKGVQKMTKTCWTVTPSSRQNLGAFKIKCWFVCLKMEVVIRSGRCFLKKATHRTSTIWDPLGGTCCVRFYCNESFKWIRGFRKKYR